jgi:membrane-associated protease RseP (regulator of RpoE activity)
MHHFSRLGTLTIIASGVVLAPLANAGELHTGLLPSELLISNSAQGYLGVGLRDVDSDRAAALKLKEARGAEITSIDQDAPASKSGIKVHDVVVQMNGQRIESIEQFRRMLRETPPGRTVSLVAMRDGQPVNISVQLADHNAIVRNAFSGLESDPPSAVAQEEPAAPLVLPSGGHGSTHSSSFFGSLTRNRNYVGVDLQPLPTGLADYFGAKNGVLVGNVFTNSPAATAGLKAADVIQKVNGQPIVSLADWEKAIRVNRGKEVQVTVIRDKKELTLTMVAGETRKSSELDLPDFDGLQFEAPDAQTLAELKSGLKAFDSAALADQVRESVKGIDAEALRNEAEALAKSIDSKALQQSLQQSREYLKQNQQQLQKQMQQLEQNLRSLEPEQMD